MSQQQPENQEISPSLFKTYKMDVICVDGHFSEEAKKIYEKHGVVWPKQDSLYTIKEVIRTTTGETGLLLEELVNPKIPILHPILGTVLYEPNWHIRRFRTLQGEEITSEMLREVISLSIKALQ